MFSEFSRNPSFALARVPAFAALSIFAPASRPDPCVFWREFMAALAVSVRPFIPALLLTIRDVVGLGSDEQMIETKARRIVASMTDLFFGGDRAHEDTKGGAMGALYSSVEIDGPISVRLSERPNPTTPRVRLTRLFDHSKKAFAFHPSMYASGAGIVKDPLAA